MADPDPAAGRVRIEFLCDLEDQPEGVNVSLPGCRAATSGEPPRHRLRRARLGRRTDRARRRRRDRDLQARFAGLEGYLLAKSYAARHRGDEKDYYDLVHVLLYNRAGGPAQAGAQLVRWSVRRRRQRFARNLFREIEARFSDPPTTPPRATSTRPAASTRKQTRHSSPKTPSARSPNSSPPSTSTSGE